VPDPESLELAVAPPSEALPGTNVNVSRIRGNESEVLVDIDPTNTNRAVVVGHAPSFSTMNTFFTADGGATWSLVSLGNAQDGLTSTFRFDPTLAFDDNGVVYVGYGAVIGPLTASQRVVVVCRSTDGGQTYPLCTRIDANNDIDTTGDGNTNFPGNDKWHLATGPAPGNPTQQNVYIAWTRNVEEPPRSGAIDQQIVVSRSTDGATSFSPFRIINDASISGTRGGNIFADPAVGPNGELYVAWIDGGTSTVLIDASPDGGVTFGTDIPAATPRFLNALIPAQPDRGVTIGPTIDVDRSGGPFDGRIFLAYVDVGAGGLPNTDVLVRSSDDHGVTWTPPVRVNHDGGTASQFLPWLDVDQASGAVTAIWYDPRNDANNQQVDVFRATSTDGGASFMANFRMSDNPSDQSTNNPARTGNNFLEYIGIAVHGCVAYPIWADNSLNPADLDYFTERQTVPGCEAPGHPVDGPFCVQATSDDFSATYRFNTLRLTTAADTSENPLYQLYSLRGVRLGADSAALYPISGTMFIRHVAGFPVRIAFEEALDFEGGEAATSIDLFALGGQPGTFITDREEPSEIHEGTAALVACPPLPGS
jgi:hypothetical protein